VHPRHYVTKRKESRSAKARKGAWLVKKPVVN